MARRKLDLGAHGEIECHAQVLTPDGRWLRRVDGDRTKAGRWRARVHYRALSGELRELSRYAPTATDARRLIKVALVDRENASGDGRLTGSTPFLDVGEAWLARIARSDSGLSARSVTDYTATWRRYVAARGSSLRGLTLAEANDAQRLRGFLERVAETHGNGASHMLKSVLGSVLRSAVRDGVLASSALLTVGQVKAQTPRATTRDPDRAMTELERDAAVAHGYALTEEQGLNPRTLRKRQATADLIAFLAGTGCRINEARTARWEDLDLASGRCHVDGTKSASADRMLNLPPWLIQRLQERSERTGTVGLVFASPAHLNAPDRGWEQSNSASAIRTVLDSAGLDWATPHTFRRTVATMLSRKGAPLADVAAHLGHRDITQTLRYVKQDFKGDKSALAGLL